MPQLRKNECVLRSRRKSGWEKEILPGWVQRRGSEIYIEGNPRKEWWAKHLSFLFIPGVSNRVLFLFSAAFVTKTKIKQNMSKIVKITTCLWRWFWVYLSNNRILKHNYGFSPQCISKKKTSNFTYFTVNKPSKSQHGRENNKRRYTDARYMIEKSILSLLNHEFFLSFYTETPSHTLLQQPPESSCHHEDTGNMSRRNVRATLLSYSV
jgi:hypothetical protein